MRWIVVAAFGGETVKSQHAAQPLSCAREGSPFATQAAGCGGWACVNRGGVEWPFTGRWFCEEHQLKRLSVRQGAQGGPDGGRQNLMLNQHLLIVFIPPVTHPVASFFLHLFFRLTVEYNKTWQDTKIGRKSSAALCKLYHCSMCWRFGACVSNSCSLSYFFAGLFCKPAFFQLAGVPNSL